MEIDPAAFFFTDHYRNYPAVLIRLADVARSLLADVVKEAWRHVSSRPPAKKRAKPSRRRPSSRSKPKLN
jgi:hypothetical protein